MTERSRQQIFLAPAEAQGKLQRSEAVAVDVRPRTAYDYGHIVGAISMPAQLVPVHLGELRSYPGVILYGSSGADRRPEDAYRLLVEQGFTAIWVLDGGISAWAAEGLPTASQDDEELIGEGPPA
jgi:rhodanese-related sulfurtransferase